MNNQANTQSEKTLKYGKAEITLSFSDSGPTLQKCIINILCSYMTKKLKF